MRSPTRLTCALALLVAQVAPAEPALAESSSAQTEPRQPQKSKDYNSERPQPPARKFLPPQPKQPPFSIIDRDASGGISLEEFVAAHREELESRFRALDRDGDGTLDESEFGRRRPEKMETPPK